MCYPRRSPQGWSSTTQYERPMRLMPKLLTIFALGSALVAAACSTAPPPPTPTPIPTVTPTATPTPLPTATPTAAPTPTPTSRPVDVLFNYTIAVRLLSAAQYEDAIPEFSFVLRVLPDFAPAYSGRGLAYYYEEQYDLALEDFNKAIELKPDLADAYGNRGAVYIATGDFETAADDLLKAIALYEAAGDFRNANTIRAVLQGGPPPAEEDSITP